MPINKKQLMRMIKFVAEMRRNRYPNAVNFAQKLHAMDINENLNISCSERTIMRDLDTLRRDFKAPIIYSPENNGYYLADSYWEFHAPVLADEMLMSAMLGARLAEELMPSPVKETIRDAVDEELSSNNSELLERTYLETLLIASGAKTTIAPEIFAVIFQGWRERRIVRFVYQKGISGEVSERDFEPHLIAYHRGNWYTKGVDRTKDQTAVFAIFRIQKAELTDRKFAVRQAILEGTRKNGLFDYPKIENIRVRCSKEIAYYLYEQRKAKKLTITPQEDGSLIVILPPSPEQEAIRWILGEGGNVEVLEPLSLRKKIHDLAEKTAKLNRG